MNGLDLFSGIAGNTLGLRRYIKTIAYCEQDGHAQSVLLSRMADGSIERAPIWDDITTLTAKQFDLPIDIIVGGFPCQDISCAGRGVGLEGKRSGLFFEIVRLAEELQPKFLFLENVPAIRTRGLDTVIQELTQIGYDCRWTMLSAANVGAKHKRERWFMLSHRRGEGSTDAEHNGRDGTTLPRGDDKTIPNYTQGQDRTRKSAGMDSQGNVADANEVGLQRPEYEQQRYGILQQRGHGGSEKLDVANADNNRNRIHESGMDRQQNKEARGLGEKINPTGVFSQTNSLKRGDSLRRHEISDRNGQRLQGGGSSRHVGSEGQNSEQQFAGCDTGDSGGGVESRLGRMADGISTPLEQSEPEYLRASFWEKEPEGVPRVTQEKEQRVERIKRLGNAVVPLQALTAFEYLMGF